MGRREPDDFGSAADLYIGDVLAGTRTQLSELARQTVRSALELPNQDDRYLFPLPAIRGAPITAHALAVAMARFSTNLNATSAKSWQADPPTPHDLRRTLATRVAELGVTKEDRDAVLNHTPRDVGKKHYDLYGREREKRRALALWASTLAAILEKRDHGTGGVSGRG